MLLLKANTTTAQVNVNDSLALVDLYNSTDGPNWKSHDNWLTQNPVNTWFGISLQNNRVIEVGLKNNQLSGSIPESLGNFTSLVILYLNNNQLSGSIPPNLGNFPDLRCIRFT